MDEHIDSRDAAPMSRRDGFVDAQANDLHLGPRGQNNRINDS